MIRAAWPTALAALVLGGCLPAVEEKTRPECTSTAECNAAAGEVCDEGLCWGDPPSGRFAAVLGPPTSAQSIAASTEIVELAFSPDGWFGDVRTGDLTLAPAVRVHGRIKAPCPSQLAGCQGYLSLGGQVRWSRPSTVPGGPRVSTSVAASSDGFELYLPRPDEPATYTVAIIPSIEPLGANLPAPAQFFPPQRFSVTINPADAEVGIERDFQLGGVATKTITGRIAPAGGVLAGWRVRAEAADADALGTFALASNIAVTASNGEFALTIPDGPTVVDLVVEPPPQPNRNDPVPPYVRVRDHVVTAGLPTIEIPAVARLVSLPVQVDGTDGNGAPLGVAGATVRARLAQEVAPGTFLGYETTTTTNPNGGGSVQLYLGSAEAPLRYTLDVLPGPSAELASVYDVEVVVDDAVPTPPPIVLPRRLAMVGQLLDEHGYALADTTLTAAVSGASLCRLSSEGLRTARGLAPATTTTNGRGEFKLWVDRDLAGTPLTYDIAIEPPVGTSAPRWTFVDQPVGDGSKTLALPEAAHVRATVYGPGQLPVPATLVSIYELTSEAPLCQQALGGTYPGGVELRAIGVSDQDGIVRVILPRAPRPR